MIDIWSSDALRQGIRKNSYLTPGPSLSVALINAWTEALVADKFKGEIPQTWCCAKSVAPSFGPEARKLLDSLKLHKIFTTYTGDEEPSHGMGDLKVKVDFDPGNADEGEVSVYIAEDSVKSLVLYRYTVEDGEGYAEITVVEAAGGNISKSFEKLMKDHPFEEKAYVYTIVTSGNSYCLETVGIGGLPLIKENYTSEVAEQYDMIVDDLKSDEPLGRLAIIDGPPGTGKTYLIRGLIHEIPECKFVIVPPHLVSHLGNPEFVSFFLQERSHADMKKGRPLVLVLEDADACLTHRDGGDMSSISAVLNLTDGIIGSLIDFRIVATTNVERVDIDEALVRAGRLSASMTIDKLTRDHAVDVYMRLAQCSREDAMKVIGGSVPLSDVYARFKGQKKTGAMKSKKSKPVGFTVR
jgi:hypothetical protein